MNKIDTSSLLEQLQALESAEQYLIARTHRELAGSATSTMSAVDRTLAAFSIYGLVSIFAAVLLTSNGLVA